MEEEPFADYSQGVELTITAVREDYNADTRTVRDPDGSVNWCPLDEISVFYSDNSEGGSKFIAQNTEQSAIAEFKGRIDGISVGGENFTNGKYLYGIYPYSATTSFNNGVTTITLPATQTAAEGTFSNGLFPTIARAQGVNLAFYNICGGVKFTVSRDDITTVIFKGNKNERLAGTAKVVFDATEKPALLDDEVDSKREIKVTAPGGGTFEAGKEYFIVAYPTALTSGFTLTFQTTGMKEGHYVSDKAVDIRRSLFGVVEQADKNITSWSDVTITGGGTNSGIYLGITGFNQELYVNPITQLTESSKPQFDSFINAMTMKYGTLLYYSVDQALNTIQTTTLPADLSTVAVVTFTDGLDQGSMMMNFSYETEDEYLDALNNRIKTETVNGLPITAYSIGIKGKDVADDAMFQKNLTKLASSSENATEVSSMAEVNAKFKEIAEQLTKSNYVQIINLTMPGVSTGTLVRFTFDNVASAENSTLYLEGTFNRSTLSLENVQYVGLTSTSGTEIKGTLNGIFVTFTFEGVRTDSNKLIEGQFTDEWTYIASNGSWQINSEFDKTENSDIVTEHSSAVIMLVLDCSSSLADDFVKAQTNAKDFINTLYVAVGGSSDSGDTGVDNSIYSTTPTDLTLAIWKGGRRYYLTQEEYKNANLSDAVIEGLTIVSGGESFILSLNDVQYDCISNVTTANTLYGDILPTASQGKTISAKWTDINNALTSFGGTKLSSTCCYYTLSTFLNSLGTYYDLICGSGGSLSYTTSTALYVRGGKSTDYASAIYWQDPDDLKLSVIIDGNREFLTKQEYNERAGEINTVEGVLIVGGGEKFILHLNNAQSDKITSVTTANTLYGDILPTASQGRTISAKWTDINNALTSFGGTKLSSTCCYYTLSTTLNSIGQYLSIVCGSGGSLSYTPSTALYVRGVTTIE
ncbi:MAG: hypothetical protein IJZ22_04370 [Bacteroidaceae bacterium]|nr:hypothetical protein [Bacteroidaceae bacterium]